MRAALEGAGCSVVFANDIDAVKGAIYEANFGPGEFVLADVATIQAEDVPDVDIATASFPCTDLSLAGGRAGLDGAQSGLLRHFLRILSELGARRPSVVMLENVLGFATSNGGEDLRATLQALNALGYDCDVLVIDARHFVPQSRQRMFIVASQVLDVFEVAEVELWPLWDLENASPKDVTKALDSAEYTVFQQVLRGSIFGAVLNEVPVAEAPIIDLPPSVRGRIVPNGIYERRKHADIRIARRASTIAKLALVISERKVNPGLRATLLTQARRLEHLARQRLEHPED